MGLPRHSKNRAQTWAKVESGYVFHLKLKASRNFTDRIHKIFDKTYQALITTAVIASCKVKNPSDIIGQHFITVAWIISRQSFPKRGTRCEMLELTCFGSQN